MYRHGVMLDRLVCALDGPDSRLETAEAARPSWGLQVFDGARVFADPAFARVFQSASARIQEQATKTI
jgi:hypothetical protein